MDLKDLQYLGKHAWQRCFHRHEPKKELAHYLLHIPKTAGTSLRYDLYDAFPAGAVYPDAWEYYIHNRARYLTRVEIDKQGFQHLWQTNRVVIGHFGLKPWEIFENQTFKTFTFFRHPVDRIWSSIRYHQKPGRRYHEKDMNWVLKKYGRTEGEMMVRMMGYKKKRQNLAECLENLEKLDSIGITEDYEGSIEKINKAFEWNLKGRHKRNSSNKTTGVPPKWKSAILDICAKDMLLYERVLQLYNMT